MNTSTLPIVTTDAPCPKRVRIRPRVIARLNARQEAIKAILEREGRNATIRRVHRVFNDTVGKASLATIWHDLKVVRAG